MIHLNMYIQIDLLAHTTQFADTSSCQGACHLKTY